MTKPRFLAFSEALRRISSISVTFSSSAGISSMRGTSGSSLYSSRIRLPFSSSICLTASGVREDGTWDASPSSFIFLIISSFFIVCFLSPRAPFLQDPQLFRSRSRALCSLDRTVAGFILRIRPISVLL